MYKKLFVILSILCVLVLMAIAEGEISVGVKNGDWVEFDITTTGTPPEEHHIVWARMEVFDVQGTEFKANVTSEFPNGTRVSAIRAFDFEIGNVQSWIIIPANLSPGDSFYDANLGRNVTIEGEEQQTFAGATRTTTFASIPTMHKRWDKSTGFFVQTVDDLGTYTVNATAIATNLWSPQILGLDQTAFYALVIISVIAVIAVAAVILIVARRKK